MQPSDGGGGGGGVVKTHRPFLPKYCFPCYAGNVVNALTTGKVYFLTETNLDIWDEAVNN